MSDKQYNAVGEGTLLSYDMYYFTPLMKKGDEKMYAELINKAKAIEKQVEGCLAKCRDEANRLLMGISTPINPDDFDKLIDDMRQIGK